MRSHGARNPTKGDVLGISKLEQFLKTNTEWVDRLVLDKPHLAFLKTWQNPFTIDTAGALHPAGMEQLYQIARRFRDGILKDLVDERGYVPHRHRFSSSAVDRTLKSAQIWSTGFFYDDAAAKDFLGANLDIDSAPKSEDWALRFFEACENFRLADKAGSHGLEFDLFRETIIEEEGGVQDAFLERLGDFGVDLDKSHIAAMYRLCVFESSLNNTETGFCSLFEASDLEAYEYLKDLSHYWSRSHGNSFGSSLAAPLLSRIIDKYEHIVESEADYETIGVVKEEDVVSFMFGHAETVIPLLSLMGLYKDQQHWRHDTPKEEREQRTFKTSKISPFSANVAILLYRCEGAESEPHIRVLHNEKDVTVPGCSDTMCPWAEFKQALAHVKEIDVVSQCKI